MRKRGIKFVAGILALMITAGVCVNNPTMLDAADIQSEETWIPVEFQEYCEEIGLKYGLSPELLIAVIEKESSGQPQVYNKNCKGLMQINEPYHRDRMEKLGVTNIYDPYGNILLGADYLQQLFVMYQDPGTVLMVYNGSSKAVKRGLNADYTEYADSILKRTALLEKIHGK